MSHGKNCNCPVCSLGKKMGMIKTDNKQTDNSSDNRCQHDRNDEHKCEHC